MTRFSGVCEPCLGQFENTQSDALKNEVGIDMSAVVALSNLSMKTNDKLPLRV